VLFDQLGRHGFKQILLGFVGKMGLELQLDVSLEVLDIVEALLADLLDQFVVELRQFEALDLFDVNAVAHRFATLFLRLEGHLSGVSGFAAFQRHAERVVSRQVLEVPSPAASSMVTIVPWPLRISLISRSTSSSVTLYSAWVKL